MRAEASHSTSGDIVNPWRLKWPRELKTPPLWRLLLIAVVVGSATLTWFSQATLGRTKCIGGVEVTIHPGLPEIDRDQVLAHEYAHVAQIERTGCLVYAAHRFFGLDDRAYEREAYCAEVLWLVRRGEEYEQALSAITKQVFQEDPFARHPAEFPPRLRSTCERVRDQPERITPNREPILPER